MIPYNNNRDIALAQALVFFKGTPNIKASDVVGVAAKFLAFLEGQSA